MKRIINEGSLAFEVINVLKPFEGRKVEGVYSSGRVHGVIKNGILNDVGPVVIGFKCGESFASFETPFIKSYTWNEQIKVFEARGDGFYLRAVIK